MVSTRSYIMQGRQNFNFLVHGMVQWRRGRGERAQDKGHASTASDMHGKETTTPDQNHPPFGTPREKEETQKRQKKGKGREKECERNEESKESQA